MKALITAATLMAVSMNAPVNAAEPADEAPRWQIQRSGTRPIDAAPAQNFAGRVKFEMLHTPSRSVARPSGPRTGQRVSDADIIEATTHLAFHAGWPSAVMAVGVARDVFKTPHP